MLKLIVGVSRKIGLPGYGSAGSSCQIEVELESGLLDRDLEAFQERVRQAQAAARRGVDEDLASFRSSASPLRIHDDSATHDDDPRPLARTATARQQRLIARLARERQTELAELLREFDVDRLEQLSVGRASLLIDRLTSASAV